ncbi:hypothetical protein OG836_05955 [Micromonospora zamorensis]|uniref:hypothetical protein n=1 Tax=Micromonospora zamorensis TaxID=709883 RepID=UPI002E22C9FF
MQRSDLLNEAERKLWDAFPRGTVVDLGEGDPTAEDFDHDTWSQDRQVRGEVIARLLLGVQDKEAGYVARVALTGARVIGELNVDGGQTEYELVLNRCWVDAPPDFTGASSGSMNFHRTRLPGLTGRDWQTRGSLSFGQSKCCGEIRLIGAHIGGYLSFVGATLTNPDGDALYAGGLTVDQGMFCNGGFTATGEVNLIGAHIAGQLAFNGATLTNPDGDALCADRLTADQGMFCNGGFTATGQIRLIGANIAGQLEFNDATLTNPDGIALNADRLTADQGMFCNGGFTATGQIRLIGANIAGQLAFNDATLTNPDGIALNADGLTADQDLFCNGGFTANGQIRLIGAHIGGQLEFNGATLTNSDGVALCADRLTVDQGMFCINGFTANGEIRLIGARIAGPLAFNGATLTNSDGIALSADGLTADQDMFCRNGFSANGQIRLLGAHIGGQLDFNGATLTNPDGIALNADRLTADQDLFCNGGFTANGQIRLPGAHIGGQLAFNDATLTNPDGIALNADGLTADQGLFCNGGFTANGQIRLIGANIAGQLDFTDVTLTNPGELALDLEDVKCPYVRLPSQVDGGIDLANARLGVLNMPAAPNQPPMRLTGLTYTDLDPDPDPAARRRITWLRRDPVGFHPQPYEQLAAYYRSIGHDRDARRVLLAKQRTRRRSTPGTWRTPRYLRPLLATAWRIPGWLIDTLSGYGYVPWRAFCWLIAAVITGTAALHDVAPKTPTSNTIANALLLALDATVPTAPFGIREKVTLTGTNYVIALGLQILGYALVLAVVPAISRTLSRADR